MQSGLRPRSTPVPSSTAGWRSSAHAALARFERTASTADAAGAEHRLAQLFQQLGQPARAKLLLEPERSGLPPGLAMMRLVHRADLAHQLGRDGLPQLRQALTVIDRPDDVYHRMASLFATRLLPPDEGEAVATSLAAWASARERLGMALAGHVRAAACALAPGAPRRARPHIERLCTWWPNAGPTASTCPSCGGWPGRWKRRWARRLRPRRIGTPVRRGCSTRPPRTCRRATRKVSCAATR